MFVWVLVLSCALINSSASTDSAELETHPVQKVRVHTTGPGLHVVRLGLGTYVQKKSIYNNYYSLVYKNTVVKQIHIKHCLHK